LPNPTSAPTFRTRHKTIYLLSVGYEFLSTSKASGAVVMKITIKARFSGSILFEGEYESTKHALEDARNKGANLIGANLIGAYLGQKLKIVGKAPILCIGPIGSREAYLMAYNTENGIHIQAGCFWGTLKEFGEKVKQKHRLGRYSAEYNAAIAMIKATFEVRGQ